MSQIKSSDTNNNRASPHTGSWPLSRMREKRFIKGEVLFKRGDTADIMYFIQKGAIRLIETGKILRAGEVIGEMGILSPFRQRTASAICEEDVVAFTMGEEEMLTFFQQQPAAAFDLIRTSVGRFIENLKKEIEEREKIESELKVAAEIQADMLPGIFPPFPDRTEFEIFAMMDPAKEVGGDFYDFFFIDDDRLCFVIGDISGKGVPAALFMAITKTVLKSEALQGLSSEEILNRVNNVLSPDNEKCMFATVFCAVLNVRTGDLQFANGGHNPPLLCRNGVSFEFMDMPKGFVIGVMEDSIFGSGMLQMNPGDIIFLYTDGVTEAANSDNELFSSDRLKSRLTKLHSKQKDITTIVKDMRRELLDFTCGAQQSDDITMLALVYKGRREIID